MADIHPLHCWGPWSSLLHWHSYCISAAFCGSPRCLANVLAIIMYQIYIHTPITTITGIAGQLAWQVLLAHLSPFPVVFVGCLRALLVRGQDFPQLWAPLPLSNLAYTHSHHYNHRHSRPTRLTGITCTSFSFPSCFCRVSQGFVSSGPGLPPALSPSSPLQSGMGSWVPSAWNGGS